MHHFTYRHRQNATKRKSSTAGCIQYRGNVSMFGVSNFMIERLPSMEDYRSYMLLPGQS